MGIAQAGERTAAGASAAMLVLLIGVSGCAHQSAQCVLPTERPTTVTELFFGRDIEGRAPLTDAEWSAFVSTVVGHEFPAGFTVMDGDGAWRDPATQKTLHERTKILFVVSDNTTDLGNRVDRVSRAYRAAYEQASVGVLTYQACGNFENQEPAPRDLRAKPVINDQ